ncbi:hypothetical protein AZE42_07094 [Rhizopogon vesiculosus]|uniref:Uncharacterized protein n=1 Tax=Rhizopogon vesiculosus TaxID=180088 RepID=A0A1J8QF30_9AGAM|nr:hypothetical protein AZE42_07094 [Rhizopogon vesiculosus]
MNSLLSTESPDWGEEIEDESEIDGGAE